MATREDGRAQPVHTGRVDRVKMIELMLDGAAQAGRHGLAHDGALLAGNGQQILFGVHVQRAAEGRVQGLLQPGRVRAFLAIVRLLAPAVFQVPHAEAPGQRLRGPVERLAHGRAAASDAAVDAKRQRDERAAKQSAAHMGQRQHAGDAPVLLRVQEMAVVVKPLFHDGLPAGAVKEGRIRAGVDKGIPARMLVRLQGQHGDGVARWRRVGGKAGLVHHVLSRKIRSMRSQEKSSVRRASRASMRPRFR